MALPAPKKLFREDIDAQSSVDCGDCGPSSLRYYEWVAKHWRHRFLIRRIKKHWDRYWPEIYKSTLRTMDLYEQENWFGKKPFEIRVLKSGGWIPDDVMFELHFFEPNGEYAFPIWVVAFKKFEVVHAQASF